MGLLRQQVDKALERAAGLDLQGLVAAAKSEPGALAADQLDLRRRREFLARVKGDSAADAALERIVAGNDLLDVNYFMRGARASNAVGRVNVCDGAGVVKEYGTGFLIAPGVMITNHHVLEQPELARRSELQMAFERDADGGIAPPVTFDLRPQELFFTSEQLDFTVVAVSPSSQDGQVELLKYGVLPLLGGVGKVIEGEWLTIVQHPKGGLKQICIRDNRLIKRDPDVLWYTTDTLAGSSGAPVFNSEWVVVALHHSGVPETRNGLWQTIDGHDYDQSRHGETDVKWIANEGIRVSRIVDVIRDQFGDHPAMRPILRTTPESATGGLDSPRAIAEHPVSIQPAPTHIDARKPMDTPASGQTVVITLNIDRYGRVALGGSPAATESALALEAAKPKPKKRGAAKTRSFPFDPDYAKRKGFDEAFLGTGALSVKLPKLMSWNQGVAAPLLDGSGEVLTYRNMSIVMNSRRRLAIYSAANVNWDGRFASIDRKDTWRWDNRISRNHQLGPDSYKSNQFDRGHLTRWQDVEWGSTRNEAMLSAADSCHWTNCSTQHAKFNQSGDWWQGLEQHILENAVTAGEFRAQVFTGPIFTEADPVWEGLPGFQYPVRFWKVASTVTKVDGKKQLFAAAFLMDQRPLIKKHGLEEAEEVPFGPYKRHQLPIAELEELVGLTFICGAGRKLSDFDPLRDGTPPPLDADQDGRADAREAAIPRAVAPETWIDLDREEPYLVAPPT